MMLPQMLVNPLEQTMENEMETGLFQESIQGLIVCLAVSVNGT